MKWTRHHLLQLDPYEFEALMAELWSRMGYEVTLTRPTADGGVDVRAISPGIPETRVAIQAKRYSPTNRVGAPEGSRYAGLALDPDVDKVVIVTTSSFTNPAIEEAERRGVRLVDGKELLDLLNKHGSFDMVVPVEQLRADLISRARGSFEVFGGHLRDLRGMQHLPQWAARFLWHGEGLLGLMILIGILGRLPLLAFAALPFFFVGLAVGLFNILYSRTPAIHGSRADIGKTPAREDSQPGSEAPSRNLKFGFACLTLAVAMFAVAISLRSFAAVVISVFFGLFAIYLYSPCSRNLRRREP